MNKLDKTKIESNVKADIIMKAKHIFDDFKPYTDGIRVLFLIHRNKEGGETNNTKVEKLISINSEEFYLQLLKLLDIKERNLGTPYRIYSSLNPRNIEKGIRQFKYEQLEADYYDPEQKHNFYHDIRNRFIGCLMQPAQRATSLFLFDCDNEEGRDVMGEAIDVIPDEHIIRKYSTKNGWHIITHPFNYTTLKLPEGVELKKDSLILLAH